MRYYLYKLKFTSCLHVGNDSGQDNLASAEPTIHSDTLFSALCLEALKIGGENMLQQVYTVFQNGLAVLSDAFPFRGEELFLPKPIWQQRAHIQTNPRERKFYKKLSLLPISMFESYLSFLAPVSTSTSASAPASVSASAAALGLELASGAVPFDVHKALDLLKDLFFYERRQCVSITGREETQPYFIGGVVFNENCGLYLIAGFVNNEIKELFDVLLHSIADSGIGGKRNVGFGHFNLADTVNLAEAEELSFRMLNALLNKKEVAIYMTLNTSLPETDELSSVIPEARFLLCRRGGYIQSYVPLSDSQKKKSIYAFASGSCFTKTFRGAIFDLSNGAPHPVYRYLKPLFMGVS